MAIACDQIKADKATKNFVFNVVYDKKLNLPDYQLIKEAVLMVYDPNQQAFLRIKLAVENTPDKTGQRLLMEKQDYYGLKKVIANPLKCLKINFNPISSPIFKAYDLDEKKPWIFPVKLKPKTIQVGSGRDNKTDKQVGWILERDWSLDMQKPNFELYKRHFSDLGYAL